MEEDFDDILDCEDYDTAEGWRTAEHGAYGYDAEDYVSMDISGHARQKMINYVVENKTRYISFADLRQLDAETFESMQSERAEMDCWMHGLLPNEMYTFGLLIQDNVLEEAFECLPTDDYPTLPEVPEDYHEFVRLLGREGIAVRHLDEPEEMSSFLFTKRGTKFIEGEDVVAELAPDEFPAVRDWMVAHHSRMIPLAELAGIAPRFYQSIEGQFDDLDIPALTRQAKTVFFGLRGTAVEAAFDIIYGLSVAY